MAKEITFDKFVRWAGIIILILGILYVTNYLSSVLLPFFIAWFFAYLLYPVVMFIENKMHVRIRALSIIIAMLTMPSVAPVRRSKTGKGTTSYGEMLKSNKALALFLLSLIIMGIGQAPLGTFLNRMIESVGGGTREMGVAILIQSGMELPIMFMSGMLLHYLSPGALLCVSFTAYSLKSVAFMCCRSLAGIYATMFTGLFCYGIYGFAGVLYANDIVQADQKVRAQSLSSLCFTGGIGGVVGNAIGGVLMDRFGLRFIYWFSLVLSLIAVSLMVLSLRALKEKQAAAALESAAE